MPEFTGTKDLRSYLRMFWRWKWLVLVFVIAAPGAAYLIERGAVRQYQSSALVGVNQTTVNTSLLGQSGSFSTTNVTAIAELVTTPSVADIAATLMHPPADAGQIAGEVSATGDPTTNFLTITARDPSSERAADIANAFAGAISRNLKDAAISQIDTAITGVKAQLAQLSPKNTTLRPQLTQQLQQLQASKVTQGGEAAILQAATPSATPLGTSTRRAVELGLLVGILLAIGAVILAENADRRLRTPDALASLTDMTLLASIPPSAFSGDLKDSTAADHEAFNTLRTALRFFNVDRPLKSVAITSPGEKEGKTTVATRLALAAARAGLGTILVDADLRRPQVGARLGIDAKDGLGAVLAGHRSVNEVLVDVSLAEPATGWLVVVPAGTPPPNPSALIGSELMPTVLQELESQSDLVIVDTPAGLAVSDPLPLMRLVTGVIMVARMNASTRERVHRLQELITSAHGNILGVVATGASPSAGHGYYASSYYTSSNGNGHHPQEPRVQPSPSGASGDDAAA